jgi:hypothetical protein
MTIVFGKGVKFSGTDEKTKSNKNAFHPAQKIFHSFLHFLIFEDA